MKLLQFACGTHNKIKNRIIKKKKIMDLSVKLKLGPCLQNHKWTVLFPLNLLVFSHHKPYKCIQNIYEIQNTHE
jgi:hypothetical protein